MPKNEEEFDWSAVTARCLAYLCLKNSEYADAQLLEQSKFLMRFGLPEMDRAELIGSTLGSMRVLASLAKKKKGVSRNGKVKRH